MVYFVRFVPNPFVLVCKYQRPTAGDGIPRMDKYPAVHVKTQPDVAL